MTSGGPTSVKRFPRLRWWCRELLAIGLWLVLIVKTAIFDFDIYLAETYFQEYVWILKYKFFGILAIVFLVCVLATNKQFRISLLYVLCYPFVVLFYLVALLLYKWPLVVAFAPAIHSVVTTFPTTVAWCSAAALSAFAIAASENNYVMYLAMTVLGVFVCRHYWLDIRRAFKPSSVFSDLAGIVRKLREMAPDPFASGARELSQLDPNTEPFKKKYTQYLESAYIINAVIQHIAQKFKELLKSRLLDGYLVMTFLFTFAATVVIFGFEYWALYKISPSHFQSETVLRIWHFVGFSFSTIMTASISPVVPSSGLAQTICHLENVAGVLLIIVGVSLLMAIQRERYREDMEQVATELDTSVLRLRSQLEQNYNLTDEALEGQLIYLNIAFVNTFRKLRGLQEITLPTSAASEPPPPIPPFPRSEQTVTGEPPPTITPASALSEVQTVAGSIASHGESSEQTGNGPTESDPR